MPKSASEIVGLIVNELAPLPSEERHRVVQASLTLLGESNVKPIQPEAAALGFSGGELSPRAQIWAKQNGISTPQLENIFHLDDGLMQIIAAEMPGKNNKEKVRNTYIMVGLAQFLLTGDAKFDDNSARELCQKFGVYDSTNHTKCMKGGNEFTGNSNKGWTLTAPGLKAAAGLVTSMAGDVHE